MPFTLIELENLAGCLEVFDDGHCPETFVHQQDDEKLEATTTPRIVRYDYDRIHKSTSSIPSSSVHVYESVLDPNDASMLYEVTASNSFGKKQTTKLTGESPWGTYVTTEEALEWIEWKKGEGRKCIHNSRNKPFHEYLVDWRQNMIQFIKWQKYRKGRDGGVDPESQLQLDDMEYIRHTLAVEAVASFFIELIPSQPGFVVVSPNSLLGQSAHETIFDASSFLEKVHGVAVWALSSTVGQSVSYHIDYAELLRYEHNVTIPPLWAGTLQCSKFQNSRKLDDDNACFGENVMQGGEFCVNLRGLDHYAEHGYKGKLSKDAFGGWRRPQKEVNNDSKDARFMKVDVHVNGKDQWVTIPYSFNRGIVHRGDLPHLSAPITSISVHKDSNNDDAIAISRVIVGFNAFGHDVGALIAKAPEHSEAFRRKVHLYRSTFASSASIVDSCCARNIKGKIELSRIRRNKGLVKLLVLAKREKVKEELRRNQEQLSLQIWHRLLCHHKHTQDYDRTQLFLRVSDIVNEFGRPNDGHDGLWPKSIDVHVHIHHMLESTRVIPDGKSCNSFLDEDGIAGPPGVRYYMKEADSPLLCSSSKKSSTAEASTHNNCRLTPLSTCICALPTVE